MPKISVPQLNISFESPKGATLMSELLNQEIPVASSCRGEGICGKCKMTITADDGSLPAPSELEKQTLEKANAGIGERLSCQIKIEKNLKAKTTYW